VRIALGLRRLALVGDLAAKLSGFRATNRIGFARESVVQRLVARVVANAPVVRFVAISVAMGQRALRVVVTSG
jgi:hypothetical protein